LPLLVCPFERLFVLKHSFDIKNAKIIKRTQGEPLLKYKKKLLDFHNLKKLITLYCFKRRSGGNKIKISKTSTKRK